MKFPTNELKEFKRQMLSVESESNLTPWERMIVTPPLLVRLMARTNSHKPRALSDLDIAVAAQFSLSELRRIYQALVWNNVDVTAARRFMIACNLDVMDRGSWNILCGYQIRRKPRWSHLKTSPEWETLYAPMLKAWEEAKAYVCR